MKLASVHIYVIGPYIWPKGSSSFQNLVAQEPSGHPLGRQSIWLPIRSPEHLVVNLVVVDAFSLTNRLCRFIHIKAMYKYIHSLHHRNTDIEPFAGLCMHPIEHLYYYT